MEEMLYMKSTKTILFAVLILLLCIVSAIISCTENKTYKDISGLKAGILYYNNYGNWKGGPNETAKDGIRKAVDKFDINITEMECGIDDRIEKLESLAETNDIVIGIGLAIGRAMDSIDSITEKYPDTLFVTTGRVIEGDNIVSITFNEDELGFIAGAIASRLSQSGKVGYIAPMPSETYKNYGNGFSQGAKHINKDVFIMKHYAEPGYDDIDKKRTIERAVDIGIDTVYLTAVSWLPIFVEELKDTDINIITSNGIFNDEGSGIIKTGTLRGFDAGVYEIFEQKALGKLKGNTEIKIGLRENENFLIPKTGTQNKFYSDDKLIKEVKDLRIKLINKSIELQKVDENPFGRF